MNNNFLNQKVRLFDRWAYWYDHLLPTVFYQAIHQRLLEYTRLPEQAKVLDIGCGTGLLLNRLALQYPSMTGIGMDASSQMVLQARRNIQVRPRLIFIQGQSEYLPFADEEFDAVFCTISLLHYLNPKVVFQEINRVIKSGGIFYLADFLPGFIWSTWGSIGALGGGLSFYSEVDRDRIGKETNFTPLGHVHLLSPVMLSRFMK